MVSTHQIEDATQLRVVASWWNIKSHVYLLYIKYAFDVSKFVNPNNCSVFYVKQHPKKLENTCPWPTNLNTDLTLILLEFVYATIYT